jgi:hypothetical protein
LISSRSTSDKRWDSLKTHLDIPKNDRLVSRWYDGKIHLGIIPHGEVREGEFLVCEFLPEKPKAAGGRSGRGGADVVHHVIGWNQGQHGPEEFQVEAFAFQGEPQLVGSGHRLEGAPRLNFLCSSIGLFDGFALAV